MSRRRDLNSYYVYIMANVSGALYTGVTNNLERRVHEHKNHLVKGFTSKYRIVKLLYYESHDAPNLAIAREKAIKGWLRRRKVSLIESLNPEWKDLAAQWFVVPQSTGRDSSLRSE